MYQTHQSSAVPPSQEPEMTDCGTISRFAQLWTKGCNSFGTHTPEQMAEDWDCLTGAFRSMQDNHLSLNISL